jgi:hypothetical protein
MVSIEEVIAELKRLSPEQVQEVARTIHGLSRAEGPAAPRPPAVPAYVTAEAVQHGWPAQLFTDVIGSLPDLERAAQPTAENRAHS